MLRKSGPRFISPGFAAKHIPASFSDKDVGTLASRIKRQYPDKDQNTALAPRPHIQKFENDLQEGIKKGTLKPNKKGYYSMEVDKYAPISKRVIDVQAGTFPRKSSQIKGMTVGLNKQNELEHLADTFKKGGYAGKRRTPTKKK